MTQSNLPGEIKCPHCNQAYAIGPQQWPQYSGRTITCKKCAQPFVVGGAPAPAIPLPPPVMATAYAPPPAQGFAPPPPRKGMSGWAITGIVVGVLLVLMIPVALLAAILLPALHKVREEALKAKCSSNMKNIAAAMITYSNTHNGEYPDSMPTLIRNSGMSSMIYVCPDSNDTPISKSLLSVTQADLAGHCSYVYVAGGLASNTVGANDVLVYDSLSDHHTRGINVLYGDYHVSWMPAASARVMIQGLSTHKKKFSPSLLPFPTPPADR